LKCPVSGPTFVANSDEVSIFLALNVFVDERMGIFVACAELCMPEENWKVQKHIIRVLLIVIISSVKITCKFFH